MGWRKQKRKKKAESRKSTPQRKAETAGGGESEKWLKYSVYLVSGGSMSDNLKLYISSL